MEAFVARAERQDIIEYVRGEIFRDPLAYLFHSPTPRWAFYLVVKDKASWPLAVRLRLFKAGKRKQRSDDRLARLSVVPLLA